MDDLNDLISRQVLEQSTPDEMRFIHDQVRETAYGSISVGERRELHRTLAITLERLSAAHPRASAHAQLAYHWSRAEVLDKAVVHSDHAGEHAFATGAYTEAVLHFQDAISWSAAVPRTTEHEQRVAAWRRCLGEAHHCLGDVDVSESHLLASLRGFGLELPGSGWPRLRSLLGMFWNELRFAASPRLGLPKLPSSRDAALAAARLGFLRVWKNDSIATLEAVLLAANLGSSLADASPSARPYSQLGYMAGLARLRKVERAYFRRARAVATAQNNVSELAHAFYTEAYLRAGEGRWSEAAASTDIALDLLRDSDDLPERETALAVRGVIARWTGDYDQGLRYADAIRTSAARYGNVEHLVWSTVLAASCLIRLGRHDEVVAPLEEAITRLTNQREWVCELRAYAHLAQANVRLGRVVEAVDAAARAMDILDRSHGPPMMVSAVDGVMGLTDACFGLCEVSSRPARVAEPVLLERAQRSMTYARKIATVFPIARHAYLVLRARQHLLDGEFTRARRNLARAKDAAARFGVPSEDAVSVR
jgi:tetratricopeptide (TPR) repeat protein